MVRTGDWFVPRLQGLVYLDKPPAIYWSVAAGFKLLGVNEWGARIGQSIALTATAYLVAAWSGAAWGKRVGRLAGAAYVTTILPGVAANALTPDTLLVLWTTAGSWSYWKWHESQRSGERWRWALLLGFSIGLALLTKGAAALVLVAPMVAGTLDSAHSVGRPGVGRDPGPGPRERCDCLRSQQAGYSCTRAVAASRRRYGE